MKCRFCGSSEGFHMMMVATYTQFYDFAGDPIIASDPQVIRGGTVGYCSQCRRRLGHVVYRQGSIFIKEMQDFSN